jgi:hypothetical protein
LVSFFSKIAVRDKVNGFHLRRLAGILFGEAPNSTRETEQYRTLIEQAEDGVLQVGEYVAT